MRPSPQRRHAPRGLCGLWTAVLALLTLVCAPLSAGPAHAGMRDCMSSVPAHAHAQGTPRRTRDTTCAAACALGGQLVAVRAGPPPPPHRTDARVEYARLDRRPAGTTPEGGTPPPR